MPSKTEVGLDPTQLDLAFPFHFVMDREAKLVQVGRSLGRTCPALRLGDSVAEHLSLQDPNLPLTFDGLLSQAGRLVRLLLAEPQLMLRGQLLPDAPGERLAFLGSPWLTDPEDAATLGLTIRDFAIHDPTLELSSLIQSQKAACTELEEVNEALSTQREDLLVATERMGTLVRNLTGAILVEDEHRRIVQANQSFCALFGIPVPSEALLGADCSASAEDVKLLFADPAKFVSRIREILEAGRETIGEEIRLADGRVLERDYVPIRVQADDRGHLWHYRDITERKRVEEALRRRGQILEAVADSAGQLLRAQDWSQCMAAVLSRLGQSLAVDRVYVFRNHWDPDGTLLTSQEHEWTAEGVIPQIDNPDLQNVPFVVGGFGRWVAALSKGNVIQGRVKEFPESEQAVLLPQEIRSLLAVPIFVNQQWWGFMGFDDCRTERVWETVEIDALRTATAITGKAMEHREAMDELVVQKDRLAIALECIGDGVVLADGNGRVMVMNSAALGLTAWPRNEAVGSPLATVLRLQNRNGPSDSGSIQEILAQGSSWRDVHTLNSVSTLTDRYGLPHPVVAVATSTAQRPPGTVVVFRDVSRELESERFERNFISAISHELRTPLTVILGFLHLMVEDSDMPETTHREFLATVQQQTARLARIVEEILEFSRFEANGVPLKRVACDPAAVLEEAMRELAPLAADKHQELRIDRQAAVPGIQADPLRLRSLIANLVGNAIKFTPPGGHIDVRLHADGHSLSIEVQDDGPGIPLADQPHLFQRFFRSRQPGVEVAGTGLGLALVKEIATRHGGSVAVQSQPGQGALFRATLPLAQPR